MLERDWVSIVNPDDPHDRFVFDVSFMLSTYACIYGAGCPGIGAHGSPQVPAHGCCTMGAHYIDEEDRERTEAMVAELGPSFMQYYAEARRSGVTATLPGGETRTRVRDGACIFLNRPGFPTGAGCALHQFALARGEHHMTYKPEVCWIVPLRRSVEQTTADDGQPLWTTTISSYGRGAWGPGGADFAWWCVNDAQGYTGSEPVYRSMEHELRAMTGDAVYEELAAHLDERRRGAARLLPFPVFTV